MMTLEESKKVLESAGIKVQEVDALKGSCKVKGLSIGEGKIRPTLYGETIKGMDEEELIGFAKETMQHTPDVDTSIARDKEYILQNCYSCIRHQTDDVNAVKWLAYGDLEEYVRLNMGNYAGSAMSTVITGEILSMAGITEDELRSHARKNLRDSIKISTMRDILSRLMGDTDCIPETGETEELMFVASNESRIHGAAVMLLEGVLQDFCLQHGFDSIYIIPSSIHEVILCPAKIPMLEINEMIKDVNETQVDETERLSDHVYTFVAAA